MARPSLFTPARAALIVRTIRETGCSLGAAARVAGIGESTLKDWRKRGAEELAQAEAAAHIDLEHEPQSFAEFVTLLEHALAGIESKLTKCLLDAASKDWRAAAWYLERRRPEVYRDAHTSVEASVQPHAIGAGAVGGLEPGTVLVLDSAETNDYLRAHRMAEQAERDKRR